jgi:hypothetical protein
MATSEENRGRRWGNSMAIDSPRLRPYGNYLETSRSGAPPCGVVQLVDGAACRRLVLFSKMVFLFVRFPKTQRSHLEP